MNKKKLATIQIMNNISYVFPVLSFIDTIADRHKSMDVSRYSQFRMVMSEMLKTRIENSYPGGMGELFVEFNIIDDFFEFAIRDKGVPGWYDFSYAKDEITTKEKDFRNYILDMYSDEVGMEKLGSEGQRVFARIKIINKVEFTAPEPYQVTEALDKNITIRQVTTEQDVIEAIRCIYSEYGYSYSYERLYYVDSFMNMLQNGEIMSFLAVNDHGQTAGHFALAFSDTYKNMPEISTVVTRKEFRGLGLFSKFMDYCETLGREKGFRALMGQPVAFHPISQKAFLRAGYTATSLLLSYIGADIESEYNKDNIRLSLTASVKMLDDNAHTTIYPPKELSDFVYKMFGRLGIKYDVCEGEGCGESTKLTSDTNKSLQMTKIFISSAGADFEETLAATVKDAIRQKSEMLELVIPLNIPCCEYCYEIAKKLEFVLSGIIPGAENGDYIIMQMLPGDDINYDNLVMVGEFEELKNDILDIVGFVKEEV